MEIAIYYVNGSHRGFFGPEYKIAKIEGVVDVDSGDDTDFEWSCYVWIDTAKETETVARIMALRDKDGYVDHVTKRDV
jgi:hypothetical protein